MTSGPYFSIVIPTFNRANKLKISLQAILNQNFEDFEVIVIDDGGQDNTCEMIAQLNDPRISYFKIANSGPLRARSVGAGRATGEWIAFCDSDDVWYRDYLENIENVTKKTVCDCVFSEYQVEGEATPRIARLENDGFFTGIIQKNLDGFRTLYADNFFRRLLEIQPIMISAYVINRNFYKKIGGINQSMDVIGSEDSDLTLRASAKGLTAYNTRCSVIIGRGDDNLSSDYIRNLEGGTDILRNILSEGEVSSKYSNDIRYAIDRQLLEIAEQYYWQRNLKSSFSNLKKVAFLPRRLTRKFKLLVKIGVRSTKLL